MADGLAAKGYGRFRRSDPAAVRMLQRGPMSIGRLGAALGPVDDLNPERTP